MAAMFTASVNQVSFFHEPEYHLHKILSAVAFPGHLLLGAMLYPEFFLQSKNQTFGFSCIESSQALLLWHKKDSLLLYHSEHVWRNLINNPIQPR